MAKRYRQPMARTLTVAEGYRLLGLPQPAAGPSLDEYRRHMFRRLEEFGVTVEWRDRSQMPRNTLAFAQPWRNHIVCPPMVDEASIAVVAHELGHVVALERCGGPLHYADPNVRDALHCVRCEVVASATGIVLIRPLPVTRAMHAEFARGLRRYKETTPGYREAIAQLDHLASDLTWYELKLQELLRGEHTMREQNSGEWEYAVADRRRPESAFRGLLEHQRQRRQPPRRRSQIDELEAKLNRTLQRGK